MKNKLLFVLVGGLILFGLIQLVPFGKTYTNPPVVNEPKWNNSQTRQMAKEHCFQCHSNETEWPWYSNIAPGSWLIAMDVIEGRERFNFSDWQNSPGELDEIVEVIQSGEMPPIQYWIFHPNSRMDDQQKQELIQALESSIK